MGTSYIGTKADELTTRLYQKLNDYSNRNGNTVGRCLALPIALLDIGSDILSTPLMAIEIAALSIITLVGVAFSEAYTLKNALRYAEFSATLIVSIPVELALAPLKAIYQLFAILVDPARVCSYSSNGKDDSLIFETASKSQTHLYGALHARSRQNSLSGRCCCLPVALLDIGLDTFQLPLAAIELAALSAIHLIGAPFSANFRLDEGLSRAEDAFLCIVQTPVRLAFAPLKAIYQVFAIAIDPQRVQSFCSNTTYAV